MKEQVTLEFSLTMRTRIEIDTARKLTKRWRETVADLNQFEGTCVCGDGPLMKDMVDALEQLASVSKRMRAFTRYNRDAGE